MTPRKPYTYDLNEMVLCAIREYWAEHGYAPTMQEVGRAFYLSRTGLYVHLRKMRAAGLVEWDERKMRTLRAVHS